LQVDEVKQLLQPTIICIGSTAPRLKLSSRRSPAQADETPFHISKNWDQPIRKKSGKTCYRRLDTIFSLHEFSQKNVFHPINTALKPPTLKTPFSHPQKKIFCTAKFAPLVNRRTTELRLRFYPTSG